MRRILMSAGLILAATVAPLSVGHAQLTFGGFAGVNFSDLDISNLSVNEGTGSRTGGMFGGYVGTHLGPCSQSGSKASGPAREPISPIRATPWAVSRSTTSRSP